MCNKFIKAILFGMVLSFSAYSETFKMSDNPIKTRISSKQLNRISVKNDRIESVIGIEEAFQFEKNEKTGDGYIRPTEANGKEPISISITTVSGKTQELLLNVDDGEANTITIENDNPEIEDVEVASESENDTLSFVNPASSYETSITECMKRLVVGDLIPIKLAITPSKNVPGFKIKHICSYNVGKFVGEKFEVTNNSNVMVDLKERNFWSPDDVALSFSDLKICKGKKVILYVLVRA